MKLRISAWAESYIIGAVTRSEGIRLAHLAAGVTDGCVVELGSHSGSSAAWIALGMQASGNHRRLYCVDPWDLEAGERLKQHAEGAVKRMFTARFEFMASAGYVDLDDVRPIQGYSTEVAETWTNGPVGLLHVDALHTFEAVRADVDAWAPHVVPGGVVVLHDWSVKKFGVRKVGAELLREGWKLVGRYEGERRKGKHGQLVLRKAQNPS